VIGDNSNRVNLNFEQKFLVCKLRWGNPSINTLLQRGVHPAKNRWNRFSGFFQAGNR
jgi:hypothetical protein